VGMGGGGNWTQKGRITEKISALLSGSRSRGPKRRLTGRVFAKGVETDKSGPRPKKNQKRSHKKGVQKNQIGTSLKTSSQKIKGW